MPWRARTFPLYFTILQIKWAVWFFLWKSVKCCLLSRQLVALWSPGNCLTVLKKLIVHFSLLSLVERPLLSNHLSSAHGPDASRHITKTNVLLLWKSVNISSFRGLSWCHSRFIWNLIFCYENQWSFVDFCQAKWQWSSYFIL